MRVALAIGWTEKRRQDNALIDVATKVVAHQADMLILPSQSLGHPEGILCDAKEIDGICDMAESSNIAILFGYLERCITGLFSATQFIASDGRALANYRCTHADPLLSSHLDDGHWLTIAPYGGRRFGLMLDGDIEAPEVSRSLVLGGTNMILHLAQRIFFSEVVAQVRAWENHCPIISLSGEQVFAFDALGKALAIELIDEHIALIDLPAVLERPTDARRPELYAQIALTYDNR